MEESCRWKQRDLGNMGLGFSALRRRVGAVAVRSWDGDELGLRSVSETLFAIENRSGLWFANNKKTGDKIRCVKVRNELF